MDLDSAIFYSNNSDAVVPFYRDILNFEVEYLQNGQFASFIFPNGARLGIKTKKEEREVPGHQTVFIGVTDIERMYKDLKTKNVTFYKELRDLPWGRDFSILDPDNNKILFIERKE